MMNALFRVVAGFCLASLAAGLVQTAWIVLPDTGMLLKNSLVWTTLFLMGSVKTAVFAAPLALTLFLLSERGGWRTWCLYSAAGAAIGVAGYLTHLAGDIPLISFWQDGPFWVLLVAGLAGGSVYWSVSGRKAGHTPRPAALN